MTKSIQPLKCATCGHDKSFHHNTDISPTATTLMCVKVAADKDGGAVCSCPAFRLFTPAEQARKDVEGWLAHTTDDTGKPKYVADSHHSDLDRDDLDDLIALLTPVFERAQAVDGRIEAAKSEQSTAEQEYTKHVLVPAWQSTYDALRERAEHVEIQRDEARVMRDEEARLRDEWRKRAEAAEADQLDAHELLTRAVTERRVAEERAERAEAVGVKLCETVKLADRKLAAAEADVARLREAIEALARAVLKDATTSTNLRVLSRAALAATERKGEP